MFIWLVLDSQLVLVRRRSPPSLAANTSHVNHSQHLIRGGTDDVVRAPFGPSLLPLIVNIALSQPLRSVIGRIIGYE